MPHAAIWRFSGDPEELVTRYEAMLADVPQENMRLHLCLRAPNGIAIVDTCPSREAFEAFAGGEFPALRARHGFPDPQSVEDFPVALAFVDGSGRAEPLR